MALKTLNVFAQMKGNSEHEMKYNRRNTTFRFFPLFILALIVSIMFISQSMAIISNYEVTAQSSDWSTPNGEPKELDTQVTDFYGDREVQIDYRLDKTATTQNYDHPLSTNQTQIVDLDEILVFDAIGIKTPFSAEYDGTSFAQTAELLDYQSRPFQFFTPWFLPYNPNAPTVLDRATGDIDGDGRDELVEITQQFLGDDWYLIVFWTFDDVETGFTLLATQQELQLFVCTGTAALGDSSGIGKDDTLGYAKQCYTFGKYPVTTSIRVWDGALWKTLPHGCETRKESADFHPGSFVSLDNAWADIDGDGREEHILASNAGAYIYDRWPPSGKKHFENARQSDKLSVFGFWGFINHGFVKLTTGDFNGDRKMDFAIHTDSWLWIFTQDGLSKNYYLEGYFYSKKSDNTPIIFKNTWQENLLTIDTNQDGLDEILLVGFDEVMKQWMILYSFDPTSCVYYQKDISNQLSYAIFWATVGDVDADGWDEVIFTNPWILLVMEVTSTGFEELYFEQSQYGPVLSGNFNGNGVILEYTGNYEVVKYPPFVLVAMAAPPTQTGISQDYANSYTSYGRLTSTSESQSNSVGVTVNSRVSFDSAGLTALLPEKAEFLGAIGITASHTWSEAFEETRTKTSSVTVATYSTGAALCNQIIYSRLTFNTYEYNIQFHPYDNLYVGMPVFISIPNTVRVFSLDQESFNYLYAMDPNNKTVPYIGNETFSHVIGHPDTYQNRIVASSIPFSKYLTPMGKEMTIGKSGSFNHLVVTMDELTSYGVTDIESSEWSGGFSVFGFGTERTDVQSSSTGYEISLSEGCEFEGRTGNIADIDEWLTYGGEVGYKWGMSVYYMTHPVGGNKYLVINYYVMDAVPYYPDSTISSTQASIPFGPLYITIAAVIAIIAIRLKKRTAFPSFLS